VLNVEKKYTELFKRVDELEKKLDKLIAVLGLK
jgi:tetrahydromethanopterin S-methyltransferase subunit G